ncbi:carbohydrate ABC transporter permease [Clostridium sp. AM58-1XD]|uniref:carbohydrate ABC transporter permease n=1 Tax=Clostridium sp. AM58-1XD TaxID=2292307 RepID=UPI000E5112A3|nr:carbohydrate ABC transporter permease [Clostridium sp. AM58-1XD]RGY97505.1 carbohydrate ABC transporter permease [Clostridium sp. AM58-1XD]
MREKRSINIFIAVFLAASLINVAFPFYLTVITSLKTNSEIARSFFALPAAPNLDNFRTVIGKGNYFSSLFNSVFVTVTGLALMSLLLPMAAYPIARNMKKSRFYRFLFYFMVAGIFIPFQVRMMPMVKLMNFLGLMNPVGLVLLYLAGSTCEGIFLYVGYFGSIPTDLEEAAYIDGATTRQIFFKIVKPLLRPMTATILIKNGLWMWNDYLMPSLVLTKPEYYTLQLFQYIFKGENMTDYSLVFASFLLGMLPVMVLYVFMQKRIIGGMMSGAVKG